MSTQNAPMNMASSLPTNLDNKNLPIQVEGEHIWKWAQMLGSCPFYQALGVGGVAAIILTARELKLPPMACLNGLLYSVKGRITMSGQLMNTMIINAGHEAKIIELSNDSCTIRFKRKNESDSQQYTFTKKDAELAGLNGDNWKKYPRDMLFNRCISAGARKYMPDVIGPYYTHDELRDDYSPPASEMTMQEIKHEDVYCLDAKKPNKPAPCPKLEEISPDMRDNCAPEHIITPNMMVDNIFPEQVEILSHLYGKIDTVCRENVDKSMKSINISMFNDLPQKHYEFYFNGMSSNIKKNKELKG